jgi:hypothetical protein
MEAEVLAIIGSTCVAAFAWLYQKAWDRQSKKVEQYEKIVEGLVAFTVGNINITKIDEVNTVFRTLWLFAPDDVIKAFNTLMWSTMGNKNNEDERERLKGEFILSLRKDSSFLAAIMPRFFRTKLTPQDFVIFTANKGKVS